jgi:Uma2 family endonuclease
MTVAVRKPPMTRDQFFDWAQTRDQRYEFDGFAPIAMTGGTARHNLISFNIHRSLYARLRRSGCRPFGQDAGLATIGDAVRYPDALVTCATFPDTLHLIPDVVVIFEVLSPTSGRVDRIVKVREYAAVPSVLRYVILEHASMDLTVLERSAGDQRWTVSTLTEGDILSLPEIGIEIPVTELYDGVNLAAGDMSPDDIALA